MNTTYRLWLTAAVFALSLVSPRPIRAQEQWQPVNTSLDAGTIGCFGFSANGHVFAAGEDGIYHLVDGNRWEMMHQGIIAFQFLTAPNGTMVMQAGQTVSFGYPRSLFQSTDHGQSWAMVLETAQGWFRMGPDGTLYHGGTSHLLRSSDMGSTWDTLSAPYRDYSQSPMAIEPDGRLIYSPGDSSTHVSTDRGDSWERTGSSLPLRSLISLDILPDGRLAAYGTHMYTYGDFVSADRGRTWQTGDTLMHGTRKRLPNGDYLLYYPENSANQIKVSAGMFRSSNNGTTWQRIDSQILHAFDIAPDGTVWKSVIPYCYRSVDGGDTWENVTLGMKDIRPLGLATDTMGNIYLTRLEQKLMLWEEGGTIGSSYALFRSSDLGTSWQKLSDSIGFLLQIDDSGRIYSDFIFPEDQVDNQRIERTPVVSHDGGQSWIRLHDSLLYQLRAHRDGIVTGFALARSEGNYNLQISPDGGSTWKPVTHPLHVRAFHRTESGVMIAVCRMWNARHPDQGLYRSLDEGTTWELITSEVGPTSEIGQAEYLFSSDIHGTIYLSGNLDTGSHLGRRHSIYRSTDNGVTFEAVLDSVTTVEFVPMNNGSMVVTISDEAMNYRSIRSDDRGTTWDTLPTAQLQRPQVRSTSDDGALYSLTRWTRYLDTANLFRLRDDANTWERFDQGLPFGAINDIAEVPDGPLFVAVRQGVFKRNNPPSRVGAETASGFSFDVAPNPISGRAFISLDLVSTLHVRATLHDMLGQTVALLADENHAAGQSTITFETAGLAAGSYLVRITAGEKSASRLVIVR